MQRCYINGFSRIGVVACCLTSSGVAAADSTGDVSGRFGVVTVGRNNLSELGDRYRLGILFGFNAGVDVQLRDSPWSVGLGWTVLVRGIYLASDDSLVEQSVDVTEADLGIRIRRRISVEPRFVFATAGGVFTTNNIPIPPASERRYLGYYAGLGYEFGVVGQWLLGVESRYSRYPSGPENVSLFLNFTSGLQK